MATATTALERRDDSLVLHADVPGIEPGEVKVEVEDGVLTISGEHTEENDERNEHYVRRERRFGSFSHSMAMPEGLEAGEIEKKVEDGAVEVRIPLPSGEGEALQSDQ